MSKPLDADAVICKVLAEWDGGVKSEDDRVELAGLLVEALEEAGHLFEHGWVGGVEVHNSRVGYHAIQRFGLGIVLDSAGNAVTVTSPHGFMVANED